ncbi:MAG: hypothetical protein COA58_11520 [Bacteroidetes bacterium]|nr:MAG: hypothetical protein COA58_11520 [Bacteroidota bacterium]
MGNRDILEIRLTVKKMKYLTIILILITTIGFGQSSEDRDTDSILLAYLLDENPTRFNADTTYTQAFYMETYAPLHSLLILDKETSGTNKFLRPLTDTILNKFLPKTKFYYCERTCNYEYNSGRLKTIYAITNNDTLTVEKLEPFDYSHLTKKFINIFHEATLADRGAKEQYSKAIGHMFLQLRNGTINCTRDNKPVSKTGRWISETYELKLTITEDCYFHLDKKQYKGVDESHYFDFKFTTDRLETFKKKRQ